MKQTYQSFKDVPLTKLKHDESPHVKKKVIISIYQIYQYISIYYIYVRVHIFHVTSSRAFPILPGPKRKNIMAPKTEPGGPVHAIDHQLVS